VFHERCAEELLRGLRFGESRGGLGEGARQAASDRELAVIGVARDRLVGLDLDRKSVV
jgi:hypothetical protein